MRKGIKAVLACIAVAASMPFAAWAADDLGQKVDSLTKEIEALKKLAAEPKAGKLDWLTVGGDYRFKVDSLEGKTAEYYNFQDVLGWMSNPAVAAWLQGGMVGNPPVMPPSTVKSDTVKNDILYTSRLGLNLKAKVTQNVSLTTRLLMYKSFGNSDTTATSGPFFADRVGQFDGTQGHTPGDDALLVDQAYATWSNIGGQPLWFSVGRRPATGGIPSHLRQNGDRPGNGGIPSLMVDYAFDGMTLGVAPDFDSLPGAYGKLCYGRAFENGFTGGPFGDKNDLKDTDMLGISIVPIDTDPLYLNIEWNHGYSFFDFPVMKATALPAPFTSTRPTTDLGDIDWYGVTAFSTLKNVGPGTLNFFGSAALSSTRPNDNTVVIDMGGGNTFDTGSGLMYSGKKESQTGWSGYVGARYDVAATRTKVGVEYNHGSKYWMAMTPAADDLWTGKLGTRGDVYEVYLIQELDQKAIASFGARAFFRIGYQYYNFDYTGSNNWVGQPVKISDLDKSMNDAQMLVPLKHAQDLYASFELKF